MKPPKPDIQVRLVEWFDDHFYKVQVEVDGEPQVHWLRSVTSYLRASPKPYLAEWRGNVGNDEANKRFWEAGEKGTRIHNACCMYTEGGVVVYQPWGRPNYTEEEIKLVAERHNGKICILHDQDELWQVWKFRRWLEETGAVILEREFVVYSIDINCAGTIDYIIALAAGEYNINGATPLIIEQSGRYIVDLKSSKNIDDDYHLQTAAYQTLYEAMTGEPVEGRIIIHTNALKTKKGIEGLATHVRDANTLSSDWFSFLQVKGIYERKFSTSKPRIFDMPSLLSTILESEVSCQTQQSPSKAPSRQGKARKTPSSSIV